MYYANVMLHAYKYEQLIQRRGRDVAWQKATLCSCWDVDSGNPQYGCRACFGKGYIYAAPVTGRVSLMSVEQRKDFQEMAGVFELGDSVMTVPNRVWDRAPNGVFLNTSTANPLFQIGMHDLVALVDDEREAAEILQKGTPIYGRPADTLLNDHVTRVAVVRKVDPSVGTITNYALGVDYTLTGNAISWVVGGAQPSTGDKYAVTYFHRPVFTVLLTLPKPRHQDGQDMPRYVALRYRAGGFDPK
jgi:hypothetical protein